MLNPRPHLHKHRQTVSALKDIKTLRVLDLLGTKVTMASPSTTRHRWPRAGTAESSIACEGRMESTVPRMYSAAFPVLGPAAPLLVTSPAVST